MIAGALALAAAALWRLAPLRRPRVRPAPPAPPASRLAVWLAAGARAPRSPPPGWCRPSAASPGAWTAPTASGTTCRSRRGSRDGAHFGTIDYFDPIFFASFYPANSEVVHAVPILAFDRDILSPLLNLGWLALGPDRRLRDRPALRPRPAGLIGGAIALGAQNLVEFQAGEALNDIVGVALVLAAVADPRQRPGGAAAATATPRGPVGIAARAARASPGLAAGLAAGTKLSFLAPVVALSVGVIVIARGGARLRTALWFGLPALARRRLLVRPQPGRDRQPDPVHARSGPLLAADARSAPSSCAPDSRSSTTRPTSTSGRTGSSPGSTTRSASSGRWSWRRSSAAASTRSGAGATRCCGCSARSSWSPRSPTCSRR